MKKVYKSIVVLLCAVAFPIYTEAAPVDVKIKVIDATKADVTITYDTPYKESTFNVLQSMNTDPSGIYSTYKLISAKTADGEVREFADFQDGSSDAIVYTKPTDTSIKVTYRLDNGLQNSNVALFRFPLFLGGNYSKEANITVEYPSTFRLLAYPNSQNQSSIPNKTVKTSVKVPDRISGYYEYDMFVLLQKKSGSYAYKTIGNNFALVASNKVTPAAMQIVTEVQKHSLKYKEVLGSALPKNMVVLVTPVRYKTRQYEVEAVQISNNIIIADQELFDKKIPDLYKKKVIIHELAHVAVGNAGLFRDEPYYARWFDEGLAVFFEEYISDNFLHKGMSTEKIIKDSLGYEKMTPGEAYMQFRNTFDYSVSMNGGDKTIAYTYKHAGLIFYNLHLKNKSYIPELLSTLKSMPSSGSCDTCDSDNIIQIITNITKLSKDDILYPYDKYLTDYASVVYTDPNVSKLFLID